MKPKSLYDLILENYQLRYDTKCVTKYVVVIKNTKNQKLQSDFKTKLFIAVSKLNMKAINNFFKLVNKVPEHKRLHTSEDIASECYVVLDRCITNVKIESIDKFYYYLNNSLNKAIFRLFEKNYAKHFGVVDNTEEQFSRLENKGYQHVFDLTEIDLSGLTEVQWEIIRAKLVEEKQKDVIKRLNLTNEQFYENFEVIKNKIKTLYNYEYINGK